MQPLSPVHGAPPHAALARALSEASAVLRKIASLAGELGEQSALTASLAIDVTSAAEVDRMAAELGTVPEWTAPWTYQAVLPGDAVTVTISFTVDPFTLPAGAVAAVTGNGGAA